MSKVTLTPVQRKAFLEVIKTANTTAAESTVKALLRRNLIAPEGDGFAVTKAGRMFIALDTKTDLTSAVVEGRKVAGRKDLPPVKDEAAPSVEAMVADAKSKPAAKSLAQKKQEKLAEDQAKRETKADPAAGMNAALAGTGIRVEFEDPSKDLKANAKAAGQTDKKVTAPKAPAKPKVDKDSTIRVSAQILTYIGTRPAGQAGSPEANLVAKLAAADLASDKSRRIAVEDVDLVTLSAIAADMAAAENAGRGDVRSARALIQWIDGMKARRASKK